MYAIITILIILVCVLLGVVVLIQNPKGGGLNASFGGVGQQLLGARRSTDVVEKATWGLAFALIILCLGTSFFVDKRAATKKDSLPKSDVEQMQMKQPYNPQNSAPVQPQGQQPQGQPQQPK